MTHMFIISSGLHITALSYNFILRCIGSIELATQEAEIANRAMTEITFIDGALMIHPPIDMIDISYYLETV